MLFKCVLAFQQIQKKNKKTLIVLINYYTIRVFATLTYSTRNQWEPVKIRWNLFAGGDFYTLNIIIIIII